MNKNIKKLIQVIKTGSREEVKQSQKEIEKIWDKYDFKERNKQNKHFEVFLGELDGFDNIFDWVGLVEKAKEIHTVDTVWCYLLYNMGIKNVTVYSRDPGNQNFFNYAKELFDKNWTYVL